MLCSWLNYLSITTAFPVRKLLIDNQQLELIYLSNNKTVIINLIMSLK